MVAMQLAELRLGERFCGPPASTNGGYACGAIAELLGGGVEVTLHRPPPLGRPLRLRADDRDGGAVVCDGNGFVAQAHPATVALGVPGTASPTEARVAAGRYPHGLVVPAVMWAALDCPGGFAAGGRRHRDGAGSHGRPGAGAPSRRRGALPGGLARGRGGGPQATGRLGAAGRPRQVLAVARTVWVTVPRPGRRRERAGGDPPADARPRPLHVLSPYGRNGPVVIEMTHTICPLSGRAPALASACSGLPRPASTRSKEVHTMTTTTATGRIIATSGAVRNGATLMAVAAAGFIGYATLFLVRNFTDSFLELGIGQGEVSVGKDQIQQFSPSLYHYVSHLHIAVSGFIAATGLAVLLLAVYGVRAGQAWAWVAAVAAPVLGLAVALPAHYPWHLDTLGHLGLIYLATLLFVVGALVSGKGLLDARRTQSRS